MTFPLENPLTDLSTLDLLTERAEIVTWQGRAALRLENGLALLPDLSLTNASMEVSIGVEQAAYPGLAFRLADRVNYELAYPVPHVSGQWDAIQYDPVFHASNTWQLYYDAPYQRAADIPTGRWFRFRADFFGERAAFAVDDQPPLIVEKLARPVAAGGLGLWTYLPAYFCDLRVRPLDEPIPGAGQPASAPPDAVTAWFAEGFGVIACEPNGLANLNRYLPAALGEIRLTRRFELAAPAEVTLAFSFSDILTLELDGAAVFEGETRFKGFADRIGRGYVEPRAHILRKSLESGIHRLTAALKVAEPFGWGLALSAHADGLRWLPVELG